MELIVPSTGTFRTNKKCVINLQLTADYMHIYHVCQTTVGNHDSL